MRESNCAARAARSLEQFFDVVSQPTIEIFHIGGSDTTTASSSKSFILFLYMKLFAPSKPKDTSPVLYNVTNME